MKGVRIAERVPAITHTIIRPMMNVLMGIPLFLAAILIRVEFPKDISPHKELMAETTLNCLIEH